MMAGSPKKTMGKQDPLPDFPLSLDSFFRRLRACDRPPPLRMFFLPLPAPLSVPLQESSSDSSTSPSSGFSSFIFAVSVSRISGADTTSGSAILPRVLLEYDSASPGLPFVTATMDARLQLDTATEMEKNQNSPECAEEYQAPHLQAYFHAEVEGTSASEPEETADGEATLPPEEQPPLDLERGFSFMA
ncbi:hypothetical protein NDU88_002718 [Pleurodeles waltl]|uniref:Uncharacterized protein n=1 Tax=Pleurodeles waltl TaxID=8319 RepID=A0AAV7VFS7_PLEWA|nr:hypothetical protein NDU88_002718 [Pleurodeles waltl]